MSERRESKKSVNAKPYVDSSHKKTTVKKAPQEYFKSNRKNLLVEFQKIQKQDLKKEKEVERLSDKQIDKMSSVNSISVSNSSIIDEVAKSNLVKEGDYDFQLPRSYIIAMTGLQQAVKQRDKELKKVQENYQKEREAKENLSREVKQLTKKDKENDIKMIEFASQITLLKETANQHQKKLIEVEQKSKEDQKKLKHEQSKVQQLQKQIQRLEYENNTMKNEKSKHKIPEQAVSKDKKARQMQSRSKTEKDNEKISKEELNSRLDLKKERDARSRAQRQIEILKKQALILAEQKIMAEYGETYVAGKHEDYILKERSRLITFADQLARQQLALSDVSRGPLTELSVLNSDRRQPSFQKCINPLEVQKQERRHQTAEKIRMNHEHMSSNYPATHSKKMTQGSMLSRQRSTSRVKSRSNCSQLVSQYRELMRHEKELIGLNYQLEVLQKGLSGKLSEGRGEIQKNYQKLRRQCEEKEMQIRQMKLFLNDPMK